MSARPGDRLCFFQDLRKETKVIQKILGLVARDMPPARYANNGRNRVSGNALA
ncbi:hypothetical protein [Microseira wollei]|uniref:hypothetical protein n=1 Tax=Microseira wollei TaxID=467598 RepID=UPI001CFDB602|nr:hypothetical protein [Microseira wollei]